ncbi:MAG: hypothetical protein JO102_03170, partial [Elusimicrobia bacterium]|nr:hypothetical protein [Elusimicrobiota bacterium]
LTNANTAVAQFTAPTVAASTLLTFRLSVIGPTGVGAADVTITVTPAPPVESITSFSAYPNPFLPSDGNASLQYDLGADGDVEITITDLFGHEVRSIKLSRGDAGTRAGRNVTVWDGRNGEGQMVANGGYVIRVEATDAQGNGARASTKLAVVR